jgi:hypothetical protein
MMHDMEDEVAIAFGIEPRRKAEQRLDADAVIGFLDGAGAVIARWTGLSGIGVLRDVASCIASVLELRMRDVAIAAWNSRSEILKYTDEKLYPPDREYRVRLKEHTIAWTYRPYIEITAAGTAHRIPLTATARFTFSGPTLRIRNKCYQAIEFGDVKASGVLKLDDLVLREQTSRPHRLKGEIDLGPEGIPIGAAARAAGVR